MSTRKRSGGGRRRKRMSRCAPRQPDFLDTLTTLAGMALATGRTQRATVDGTDVVAVPDLAVIEGAVNGWGPLPPTFIAQREDGRTVAFFKWPA